MREWDRNQLFNEGIENRILQTIERATSFEHLMTLLKTKRYTYT
ncbi:nucleotidyltransferase family protein, partial [Corynebacterium diphtheriae]